MTIQTLKKRITRATPWVIFMAAILQVSAFVQQHMLYMGVVLWELNRMAVDMQCLTLWEMLLRATRTIYGHIDDVTTVYIQDALCCCERKTGRQKTPHFVWESTNFVL